MNPIKIIYNESCDTNTCFLSKEQEEAYELTPNTNYIKLKFGSLNSSVTKVIVNNNHDVDTLYLSKDLRFSAFIPPNTLMQLQKIDENCIEIGPIIGVFINSKKVAAMSEGKSDSVYEQISYAAKSLYGISCFFSSGDIDWEKRIVKAMVWNSSKWISRILPLPNVIYDRCFGSYGRIHAMEFRNKLGKEYKVINSIPKLAKLETINALRKNPALINSIPETSIYHSSKDIEEMLLIHPSVYLKPDALYKGKGIFRISKDNIRSYKVEHRLEEKNEIIYMPNLDTIDNLIGDYSVLGGGYLIQEEIKKASYHDYPFDFRLLYQKDWQGMWQPTGIAVRMGAPGSIITSPRSGGAVAEFSSVLKDTFQEDLNTDNGLYENVVRIGREVVKTIEKEFGDCVELGLDMTIDINRRIWIIEVNGKPLKVSLKWLNDQALMTRCYNRPLEYAVFLTGFVSANTELGGIKI
jgi:hypothetical protein